MVYSNKDIYLHKEATSKIITGINKLCNAVKVTMGPSGKTVIISDEYGKPYATKDGVSVAEYTKLQDPVENIGCTMAKEAAKKTAEEAGDGTTTASVLIQALIAEGMKYLESGGSYNDIKVVYSTLLPQVLEKLKKATSKLTKKEIADVATISANNERDLGELIAKAFRFSKIVKVEEGREIKDLIERVDGVKYPVSYMSKLFITDEGKQAAKLENPVVLLTACKIDRVDRIRDVIRYCNEEELPLVVISEHITSNVLSLLEQNQESGALQVLPIKIPGFGKYRNEYIKDISIFSGATIIKNLKEDVKITDLGSLKQAEATLHNTVMLPKENTEVTSHIKNLSKFYSEAELTDYDKEILGDRIKNLNAKVAIIKVGGKSEIEKKEKYDRIEDATCAVASALEEGVIQGGGLTLHLIAKEFESTPVNNTILKALSAPLEVMNKNGANITVELNKNIIDPVKVTRCALENAASIALTILGTEAVVLNEGLWN